LAAANAWSNPISCSIEESGLALVAGSQLPAVFEQSMPGSVAVGKVPDEPGLPLGVVDPLSV
jgi:hypothetical protein